MLCDSMGLDENEGVGLCVDDIPHILKGCVPDRYEVRTLQSVEHFKSFSAMLFIDVLSHAFSIFIKWFQHQPTLLYFKLKNIYVKKADNFSYFLQH